jgi:hypothetical protein
MEESEEHALCHCTRTAAVRQRAVDAGMLALERPLEPHWDTEVDRRESHDWGPGQLVPVWFDPLGNHTIRVAPRVSDDAKKALREHPILPGFLGVLPPLLDEVLKWEFCPDSLWRRRALGDIQTLIAELQGALIWGGLKVWSARCRAYRVWWVTDEAKDVRLAIGVVEHAAQRAYDREQRKQTALHGMWPRPRPTHLRAVPPTGGLHNREVRTTPAAAAAAEASFQQGPVTLPPSWY